MQKTVQAIRREVGLNPSTASREKLFENVRVEGKNRTELRKELKSLHKWRKRAKTGYLTSKRNLKT